MRDNESSVAFIEIIWSVLSVDYFL